MTHFRIQDHLGSGGMGKVYLAEDTRLGRQVALKVLAPEFTKDSSRLRRFEREARAASALNHPNIVTIYDIGESDAGRFIVMELVAGKTLRDHSRAPTAWDAVANIGRQIAEALEVAHRAGIVHRDIKPQNVMVRDDGYVKVLDFGLVRLMPHADIQNQQPAIASADSPSSDSDEISRAGLIVGTASYMSPEQAKGDEVTAASDLFSLGILLYQLAIGRHPFAADSEEAYLKAIISQSPISPSTIRPDIPREFAKLMLDLLQKDARLRPSAAQARHVLTAIARQEPLKQFQVVPPPQRQTVGREHELTELQSSFDRVAAGRGELVCISGEPGIGKTTLVEDFLASLGANGRAAQIGRGRCSERLENTEAYLPLLEALDRLLQDNLSAGLQALKAHAPTWYIHVAPLNSSDGSAARIREDIRDASQDRMKRELAALFGEISRTRPMVLFLDDLHWADVATIEQLSYVASRFDGLRVLIVATFRPTELLLSKHPFSRIKQDLQGRGSCREISLHFLSRAEIERYLAQEFPQHHFPPEFVDLIHRKTEGSPLFMVNLVRHLQNRQMILEVDGRWELVRPIAEFESELPEGVRSMIERKLDPLHDVQRNLLTAASVQGDTFDAAVVAEALGADPLDVEDQLSELDKVHALITRIGEREFPDLTLTIRYRFVHALYHEAFYKGMNPARRAALSRAVAESLLRMYRHKASQIAGDLALLFRTGREFEKAGEFFVLAAVNATGLAAHRQAAALLTQALEIAKRLGDDARITELRARRGHALSEAEMWADARTDLESAAANLTQDHSIRRAEVLIDLALTCFYLSDGTGIRSYGGEALALADEAGRDDLAARALHALGYSEDGQLHESVERCERALARDPTHRAPLEQLGRVLYWMGRPNEAITRSSQAAEWCRHSGRTSTGIRALGDLGLALTATGRFGEALEVFHQGEQLGHEFEIVGHRARTMVMRGGLHLHLFDFAGAQAIAEEARELTRTVEWPAPAVSAGLDLLSNFARCGQVGRAEALVDEVAEGVVKAPGAHGWLWKLRFAQVQADLARARADWHSVIDWANDTIAQSRTTSRVKYEITGLLIHAEALTAIGRKHEAIADAQHAVSLARSLGDPVMFLRSVTALLDLDGSDQLAAETRQAVQRITSALPNDALRRAFDAAEPVRLLATF